MARKKRKRFKGPRAEYAVLYRRSDGQFVARCRRCGRALDALPYAPEDPYEKNCRCKTRNVIA